MNAPESAAVAAVMSRAQRQAEVLAALQPLLPAHALLWRSEDTVPYECDGLTAYREQPLLVALPETEAQVAAVLRCCHELKVPVVARGAQNELVNEATFRRPLAAPHQTPTSRPRGWSAGDPGHHRRRRRDR